MASDDITSKLFSAMNYFLRAKKIAELCNMLSPAPTGSIDDLSRVAGMVHVIKGCAVGAPFDVERPVHVVLNDIGRNVVDFIGRNIVEMDKTLVMPPGMDAYMLPSYPMMLTLSLRPMVEHAKVAVKDIDGKGKGVVATSNIAANTIVTFYPFDLVRVRCYEMSSTITGGMSSFFSPHKHFRDAGDKICGISKRLDDYKYSIGNVDIYGDPEAHPNDCCGHIINDGDGPVKSKNNSVLVPLFGGALIAVVAVFDIKNGTEVLCSYGDGYWTNRV